MTALVLDRRAGAHRCVAQRVVRTQVADSYDERGRAAFDNA